MEFDIVTQAANENGILYWEKSDHGWFTCYSKNATGALGSVFKEGAKWCVYVNSESFPGDGQFDTKASAVSRAEKLITDNLEVAYPQTPMPI